MAARAHVCVGCSLCCMFHPPFSIRPVYSQYSDLRRQSRPSLSTPRAFPICKLSFITMNTAPALSVTAPAPSVTAPATSVNLPAPSATAAVTCVVSWSCPSRQRRS